MGTKIRPHALLALFASVAFLLLFVAAAPASAHLVGVHGKGWRAGLEHPFSGIDHIVAMVAVGVWAAQIGRKAIWVMPTVFLLTMVGGALVSFAGFALPGIEDGVALSVAVLGVLLAVAARPRPATAALLVSCFGFFHGYSHGAQMPDSATPILYGLGFIAATALLQLLGIGLGLGAQSGVGRATMPIAAAVIVGIGITLVLTL
jgi:urease accessory protein